MALVSFVNRGIQDDDGKFAQYGVDPLSAEAVPYYARWIRQDIMGLSYMINRIIWLGGMLLILIAVPIWIIALR